MAWEDKDWQLLLTKIKSGEVIPVIGKDLIRVGDGQDENGKRVVKPMYDWICEELIDSNPNLNLSIQDFYHLESLSAKIIRNTNSSDDELKLAIAEMVDDNTSKELASLEKLAQITDFRLFINTTFTPYLTQKLKEIYTKRNREELAVYEINYSPNAAIKNLKTVPLKDETKPSIKNLEKRCVLNLFGDYDDNDATTFLLTDSEIVDLLVYLLINNEWKESKLFDLIKSSNSHFLFIGCSFPDWLFKFFVRVFSKEWSDFENTKRNKFLADCLWGQDHHRTMFLTNYRVKVYPDKDVSRFVDELYTRWMNQQGLPTTQVRDHIVFISFANEDREVVTILSRIFQYYKIDYWLDQNELDYGDNIRPELEANIDKACVFIPVITQHSLIKRDRGDFLLEWDYAIRRQKQRQAAGETLEFFPISIDLADGTPIPQGAFGNVRSEFWNIRRLRLSEHALRHTDDFSSDSELEKYMTAIRDIQRKKRMP